VRTKPKKKRTKALYPKAILCADLHMWHTPPRSRRDEDYAETCLGKLQFIVDLQNKYPTHPPILIAGDIFEHPKPPYWFLNKVIQVIQSGRGETIAIAGQHDLPHHRLELIEDSGLSLLPINLIMSPRDVVGCTGFDVVGFPYGAELLEKEEVNSSTVPTLALAHVLAWEGRPPFSGAPASGNASRIKKKMKGYDLIVCGDNHDPFQSGRLLNCGCLIRKNIDQVDYQPRIYEWMGGKEVNPVDVPLCTGVHLEETMQEEKEVRADLTAFVEALADTSIEVGVDFEENVRGLIAEQKIDKEVEDEIWQLIPKR